MRTNGFRAGIFILLVVFCSYYGYAGEMPVRMFFDAPKKVFQQGDVIDINIHIENYSKDVFVCQEHNYLRCGKNDFYLFDIEGLDKKILRDIKMPSGNVYGEVKPAEIPIGDRFTQRIPLNSYFDLNTPNKYGINIYVNLSKVVRDFGKLEGIKQPVQYVGRYEFEVKELSRDAMNRKIDEIKKGLKSQSREEKLYAICRLGYINSSQVAEPLIEMLNDGNEDVRNQALNSLIYYSERAYTQRNHVQEIFNAVLIWDDYVINRQVVTLNGYLNGRGNNGRLVNSLAKKNTSVKIKSAFNLNFLEDEDLLPYISIAASHSDDSIRMEAAECLCKYPGSEAKKILRNLAKDENPFIRMEAAKSLIILGEKSATEPLMKELVAGKNEKLAKRAAEILSVAGDAEDADELIRRLDRTQDIGRKRDILQVVREISPGSAIGWVAKNFENYATYAKPDAIGLKEIMVEIVFAVKSDRYYGLIRNELVRAHPALKEKIFSILAEEPPLKMIDILKAGLYDRDSVVRKLCVSGLGKLAGENEIPIVIEKLKDDNVAVRQATLEVLTSILGILKIEYVSGNLHSYFYNWWSANKAFYDPVRARIRYIKAGKIERKKGYATWYLRCYSNNETLETLKSVIEEQTPNTETYVDICDILISNKDKTGIFYLIKTLDYDLPVSERHLGEKLLNSYTGKDFGRILRDTPKQRKDYISGRWKQWWKDNKFKLG